MSDTVKVTNAWGVSKEFITDQNEILNRLSRGEMVFQSKAHPTAVWICMPGATGLKPNIRYALFLRLEGLGYVERALEESYQVRYRITRRGERAFEAICRKRDGNGSSVLKEEIIAKKPLIEKVIQKPINIPTSEYLIPVKEEDRPLDVRTITLRDSYLVIVEVRTEKEAGELRRKILYQEPAQQPLLPVQKDPTCDFCKKTFPLKKIKKKFWRRACKETACKREYGNALYAFKKKYGRNPTAADRGAME